MTTKFNVGDWVYAVDCNKNIDSIFVVFAEIKKIEISATFRTNNENDMGNYKIEDELKKIKTVEKYTYSLKIRDTLIEFINVYIYRKDNTVIELPAVYSTYEEVKEKFPLLK